MSLSSSDSFTHAPLLTDGHSHTSKKENIWGEHNFKNMHIYMHKAVNVAPTDDNPYAWWSYGLEVMETGTFMVLDGIRAQRKGVGLMQKAHEERGENSEEDKTDEEVLLQVFDYYSFSSRFGRVFSEYLIITPFRRVLVEYLSTIFRV